MIRIFVVLNPVAGRTQADDVHRALKRHFTGPAWHVKVYETTGQESVPDVVRGALGDGADWILAAGGDGTVSAVVDALAGTDIPLGIIPAGSGNVIAQELGLPLSINKACSFLAGKPGTRALDAIRVGNNYYILGVSTGVGAQAIETTGRREKRLFGPFAYVWSVLKVLIGAQPHSFTLVLDGQRRRVRAADVSLANVATLTGPLQWAEHIKPDDGQIDVAIMRARNFADFLLVAWDVIVPRPARRDRNLRFLSACESMTIQSDRPLPVQGDGELLGQTPFEARVIPAAVKIFAPAKGQRPLWKSLAELPKQLQELPKYVPGLPSLPNVDQGETEA